MPEFSLPSLPYAHDALEPHIDAQTMELHHGKHHNTYVTNVNNALKEHPDLQGSSIQDMERLLRNINTVPESIRQAVINNGGGHHNHSLFWEIMGPNGGGSPSGALADAINAALGGVDQLKSAINDAGAKRFGSGWSWLVLDGGSLKVLSTANQDSPLMNGQVPILGVDVWEHAYYLKYQNRRPEYLTNWWNTVNWDAVAKRFQEAGG
jgi:superoxide dismutase, Fe-Mn family